MVSDTRARHAACLQREAAWLKTILEQRFAVRAGQADATSVAALLARPPALKMRNIYARIIKKFVLGPPERLVLALALLPDLMPALLDPFLLQNQTIGRRFSEFGGIVGRAHGGLIPTVETALFLLAGDDLALRLRYLDIFAPDHGLLRHDMLNLAPEPGEPAQAAALRLTPRYLALLGAGVDYEPPPSAEFPAARLSTPLDWKDLILEPQTLAEIDSIRAWIDHGDRLMQGWGLARRLKPGYRSLFYGPPGTGKTLTASLLGKSAGMPVYRVDLSMVVSKWIGETEKNLARLFDQAQHQHWVLFFDEADALFGKRTETRSANDRAANQQISYLLQRIEDFPGVVILATNLRGNLDEAFVRRFQSIILFRMPDATLRRRIWHDLFTGQNFALADDIDLDAIADEFELAAGAVLNVLRYACLQAVRRQPAILTRRDLHEGIRAERHKEQRMAG
jgi:hypothetical protein